MYMEYVLLKYPIYSRSPTMSQRMYYPFICLVGLIVIVLGACRHDLPTLGQGPDPGADTATAGDTADSDGSARRTA